MTQLNRTASLSVDGVTGTQAIIIEKFRISFNITKTEDKAPNTAKIEVFNLAADTRNLVRMDEDPKTDQLVTLNAGYKDERGEEVLFVGTITSIYHRFDAPLVITTIEANDGKGALSTSKVSLSQASNSSASSALKNILDAFPIPNNLKTIPFVDKIYKNGFASSGMMKKEVKLILKGWF